MTLPGMEESCYDSRAPRRFAGVDLGMTAAPDETTIPRFRHLLEQHERCGRMPDAVNLYLECKGIATRIVARASSARARTSACKDY
jgi:IS5 family transposase